MTEKKGDYRRAERTACHRSLALAAARSNPLVTLELGLVGMLPAIGLIIMYGEF